MLYSFEIFSDVMKDEGNYVTRNENKAYQTGISNITNIDKIDGSKNTVTILIVWRKTMLIIEIVGEQSAKQNMACKDV